ncbi:MAG: hypothetical protein GF375_05515, partial [Candidatus Omnitrophica bacterium]|nr:hypothetical protein [Candidatus Omnitrophota bacterium]MBD3269445.1 hypothetical protein [Candidatus Omnitrophota bacterium]
MEIYPGSFSVDFRLLNMPEFVQNIAMAIVEKIIYNDNPIYVYRRFAIFSLGIPALITFLYAPTLTCILIARGTFLPLPAFPVYLICLLGGIFFAGYLNYWYKVHEKVSDLMDMLNDLDQNGEKTGLELKTEQIDTITRWGAETGYPIGFFLKMVIEPKQSVKLPFTRSEYQQFSGSGNPAMEKENMREEVSLEDAILLNRSIADKSLVLHEGRTDLNWFSEALGALQRMINTEDTLASEVLEASYILWRSFGPQVVKLLDRRFKVPPSRCVVAPYSGFYGVAEQRAMRWWDGSIEEIVPIDVEMEDGFPEESPSFSEIQKFVLKHINEDFEIILAVHAINSATMLSKLIGEIQTRLNVSPEHIKIVAFSGDPKGIAYMRRVHPDVQVFLAGFSPAIPHPYNEGRTANLIGYSRIYERIIKRYLTHISACKVNGVYFILTERLGIGSSVHYRAENTETGEEVVVQFGVGKAELSTAEKVTQYVLWLESHIPFIGSWVRERFPVLCLDSQGKPFVDSAQGVLVREYIEKVSSVREFILLSRNPLGRFIRWLKVSLELIIMTAVSVFIIPYPYPLVEDSLWINGDTNRLINLSWSCMQLAPPSIGVCFYEMLTTILKLFRVAWCGEIDPEAFEFPDEYDNRRDYLPLTAAIQQARTAAKKHRQIREASVGTVIVDSQGEIIARKHNASRSYVVHSEQRAVAKAFQYKLCHLVENLIKRDGRPELIGKIRELQNLLGDMVEVTYPIGRDVNTLGIPHEVLSSEWYIEQFTEVMIDINKSFSGLLGGLTLYVTLEPCRKCADMIIAFYQAGIIDEVVYAIPAAKKGAESRKMLEEAGVSVRGPISNQEIQSFTLGYLLYVRFFPWLQSTEQRLRRWSKRLTGFSSVRGNGEKIDFVEIARLLGSIETQYEDFMARDEETSQLTSKSGGHTDKLSFSLSSLLPVSLISLPYFTSINGFSASGDFYLYGFEAGILLYALIEVLPAVLSTITGLFKLKTLSGILGKIKLYDYIIKSLKEVLKSGVVKYGILPLLSSVFCSIGLYAILSGWQFSGFMVFDWSIFGSMVFVFYLVNIPEVKGLISDLISWIPVAGKTLSRIINTNLLAYMGIVDILYQAGGLSSPTTVYFTTAFLNFSSSALFIGLKIIVGLIVTFIASTMLGIFTYNLGGRDYNEGPEGSKLLLRATGVGFAVLSVHAVIAFLISSGSGVDLVSGINVLSWMMFIEGALAIVLGVGKSKKSVAIYGVLALLTGLFFKLFLYVLGFSAPQITANLGLSDSKQVLESGQLMVGNYLFRGWWDSQPVRTLIQARGKEALCIASILFPLAGFYSLKKVSSPMQSTLTGVTSLRSSSRKTAELWEKLLSVSGRRPAQSLRRLFAQRLSSEEWPALTEDSTEYYNVGVIKGHILDFLLKPGALLLDKMKTLTKFLSIGIVKTGSNEIKRSENGEDGRMTSFSSGHRRDLSIVSFDWSLIREPKGSLGSSSRIKDAYRDFIAGLIQREDVMVVINTRGQNSEAIYKALREAGLYLEIENIIYVAPRSMAGMAIQQGVATEKGPALLKWIESNSLEPSRAMHIDDTLRENRSFGGRFGSDFRKKGIEIETVDAEDMETLEIINTIRDFLGISQSAGKLTSFSAGHKNNNSQQKPPFKFSGCLVKIAIVTAILGFIPIIFPNVTFGSHYTWGDIFIAIRRFTWTLKPAAALIIALFPMRWLHRFLTKDMDREDMAAPPGSRGQNLVLIGIGLFFALSFSIVVIGLLFQSGLIIDVAVAEHLNLVIIALMFPVIIKEVFYIVDIMFLAKQAIIKSLGIDDSNNYPLAIPQDYRERARHSFGPNRIITDVRVNNLTLPSQS